MTMGPKVADLGWNSLRKVEILSVARQPPNYLGTGLTIAEGDLRYAFAGESYSTYESDLRYVLKSGDTMTGALSATALTASTGDVTSTAGGFKTGATTRISAAGAATFTTLLASGMAIVMGLTDSTRTAGRVLFAGTGGVLSDSSALQFDSSKADFGVGVSRTIAGSTGATSESGEVLIASGSHLDGLYCLRWDASNRVERIWFRVTAHAYDPNPQITVLQYFSYNGAKVFQTLRIRASGDSATRYISVTVGNLNGSTAGINVVAMLLDAAAPHGTTIGGTLPGGTTSVKSIVPDNAMGIASTLGADLAEGVVGREGFTGWGTATAPALWHIGQGAFDATRVALAAKASGDTLSRFLIREDGKHEWGTGSTRTVNLFFGGTDVLKTDDAFDAASYQTGGTPRISAAGAATFTTLSTSGPATMAQATVSDLTTGRMVSTTTAGRLQALDAAASRALIDAASNASEKATAGRVWRTKVTTSTLYTEWDTGVTAYGGGVWVQALGDVSAGSTVSRRSTDDGESWTEIVLPVAARWYGLTWCSGSSLFILVGGAGGGGGAGVVLTSPDGVTWTSRTNSLSYPYGVAANGNTVVVACNVTTQGRSTDGGLTWSTFASPGGYSYQKIVFAGGRFSMRGNAGAASSADGTTWSSAAAPAGNFTDPLGTHPTTYFRGVWWTADGNGLFRSTDGHTWTAASAQVGWFVDASPTSWRAIVSSGNAMIAYVQQGGGNDAVLVTIDGVWWDLAKDYGNLIGTVAQQGSQFYAFGYRGPTQGFTARSQA